MVKVKNALYACASYIVSIVALYGFSGSVGGPPDSGQSGGREAEAISVKSTAESLKGGFGTEMYREKGKPAKYTVPTSVRGHSRAWQDLESAKGARSRAVITGGGI